MRILLLHDYGTLSGGAEVMIDALRGELRRRGHDVLLFTSRARPLPLPILADETCFGTVSPMRRLLQAANPDAVRRLRRVLADFAPDIVHSKMFLTQLSPLVLPLLRPIPSLLHVINYNLICPVNTKTLPDGAPCRQRAGIACHASGCLSWLGVARAAVQRRSTRLEVFDRIVANSRWVAGRLRDEGVRVDAWLPNGVARRLRRPPLVAPPAIGFAGRLVAKKGVDLLLRAVAEIRRRVPAVRLRIVGDGPERARLESLAANLDLGPAVEFLGHLPAEAAELALATAWVQAVPSRWEEPFGLVAAEAMMRGTAVVATRAGGLAEQVTEGETGYLAENGSAPALTAALERVLRDRGLAERLGAEGRRRALAELTLDRHVDRVLAFYDEILPAAGAEPPARRHVSSA